MTEHASANRSMSTSTDNHQTTEAVAYIWSTMNFGLFFYQTPSFSAFTVVIELKCHLQKCQILHTRFYHGIFNEQVITICAVVKSKCAA